MATNMTDTIKYGHEMADDFPCSSCLKIDKDVDSVKYCVECKEYLCEKCLEYHGRFSSTKDHNVTAKSKVLVPKENLTVIDVSFQSDTASPRDVPGICAVTIKDGSGRYAILTDWYNESVKVLDLEDLKVVRVLKLGQKPYGVCELPTSGLFAVTLRDSDELVLLEFNPEMLQLDLFKGWDPIQGNGFKPPYTAKVKEESRGIISIKGPINDTILIVSGGDPRKKSGSFKKAAIGVYGSTKTNDLLHPIYFKEISSSKSRCYPRNIVVSKDCKKTFLTDQAIGVLVCDMDGKEVGTISDPIVKEARGICADNDGNLYIAGQASNNIVKFTADGHLLGELVNNSHGLAEPISVCFMQDTRCLLVGLRGKDACMKIKL